MESAKKLKHREAIAQVIRESQTLSKERKQELQYELWRLPLFSRSIKPEEKDEWFKLHAHSDRYHGCVGGHITKTECYTSIGTMVTYKCSSCGEEAWVDDEF